MLTPVRLTIPFLLVSAVTLTAAATSGPSTPEQRARIAEFSKQYEADILGEHAKDIATPLVKWWTDVPDLSLNWCANLLVDERPATQELRGAIAVEALLAAGVHVIQHFGQPVTNRSMWLAGLEGVVRAYQNLLTRDPKLRDVFLDKLSDLHKSGKLEVGFPRFGGRFSYAA